MANMAAVKTARFAAFAARFLRLTFFDLQNFIAQPLAVSPVQPLGTNLPRLAPSKIGTSCAYCWDIGMEQCKS
jgi:hypothetical protein